MPHITELRDASKPTFQQLVDVALLKYPKARPTAVSNFAYGYHTMNYECTANLRQDTAAYKWQAPTVNAIKWVISQRSKHGV